MNQRGQEQDVTPLAKCKFSAKKPYQKPEVRHERVFETMALQCGKVHVTQGTCHYNRKSS